MTPLRIKKLSKLSRRRRRQFNGARLTQGKPLTSRWQRQRNFNHATRLKGHRHIFSEST